MSYFTGTIYSQTLKMDTAIAVLLPQDSRKHRGDEELHAGITPRKKPKTLILLHGITGNYQDWFNRSSILRYAEDYDIAVLMPEVAKSFYQDMKYGPAYFSYIADELPQLASDMFNVSIGSEDCIVAGLSMGGYGSLFAALTYPERFYGVGCFSSAFDLKYFIESDEFAPQRKLWGWENERLAVFGEKSVCPEESNLFLLAEKTARMAKKFRIYMTCGTEDYLYESNVKMRDLLLANSYDVKYEEWPGVHEWGFWDISVQKMLQYFLT
jgi:S-formylglutathione hydrolase FrmB